MAGYTRQSTGIVDGGIVSASDLNDEFDQIETALGTLGHNHNGTAGNGPKITSSGLADDAVLTAKINNLAVTNAKIAADAVTGDKIDSTTTVTAASFVGPVTGDVTGNVTGNLTGNVTGDVTGDLTGNADTATALATARTIALSGDVSGSASFDGTANVTITATVADDSHNHVTGNIDGFTEAVQDIVGGMVTGNTETGLSVTYDDADGTLDFALTNDPTITLSGAVTGSGTMTNLGNVTIATTATSDPTLTLSGDVSGSATFTNLGNATLTATVANDSHTHDGRYFTETESDARYLRSDTSDTASGTLTFNGLVNIRGDMDLADNDIIRFGSGDDFEMFCNGSHMYMDLNSGIGNLYIRDGTTTRFTFDDNGTFTASSGIYATAFYYSSDERLKQDIVPLETSLDKITNLQGVSYTWKESGKEDVGLIAQEVQKIIPEAVNDDGEFLSVNATPIVAHLIEAVKELTKRVEELEAK